MSNYAELNSIISTCNVDKSGTETLTIIFGPDSNLAPGNETIQYIDEKITTLSITNHRRTNHLIEHFLDKLSTSALISSGVLLSLTFATVHITDSLARSLLKWLTINKSLKLLKLHCGYTTDATLNTLFQALLVNTNLKRFMIEANSNNTNFDVVCDVIHRNKTLVVLEVIFAVEWSKEHIDLLINSLVTNNSLKVFSTYITNWTSVHKLMDGIQSNTKLLNVSLVPTVHHTQNDSLAMAWHKSQVRKLTFRNKVILWKNVHPFLLNFTLIFHKLPAYVLLEIFDWVPYMHLANYLSKIQLIISIKKSISTLDK